jgi:prepilin-type N-terminal cleavage/methylation domain-containing protein
MSRPHAHRRQDGFTLMELLIGIVIGTIFMFAIYGFYDSSLASETTHQNQVLAQSESRDALNELSSQLREAVSPDDGITPPIVSLSPTQIEFYADMSRSPTELTPKPEEFLYQVSGGALVREVSQPVGAAPPYTYGAFSSPETLIDVVGNAASVPMFSAIYANGTALGATISAPTTLGIALVHVNMLVNYKVGNAATQFSLTTDVVPQNPTSASN